MQLRGKFVAPTYTEPAGQRREISFLYGSWYGLDASNMWLVDCHVLPPVWRHQVELALPRLPTNRILPWISIPRQKAIVLFQINDVNLGTLNPGYIL
jgi:hypothetical protein